MENGEWKIGGWQMKNGKRKIRKLEIGEWGKKKGKRKIKNQKWKMKS